jgi:hypothetical protein
MYRAAADAIDPTAFLDELGTFLAGMEPARNDGTLNASPVEVESFIHRAEREHGPEVAAEFANAINGRGSDPEVMKRARAQIDARVGGGDRPDIFAAVGGGPSGGEGDSTVAEKIAPVLAAGRAAGPIFRKAVGGDPQAGISMGKDLAEAVTSPGAKAKLGAAVLGPFVVGSRVGDALSVIAESRVAKSKAAGDLASAAKSKIADFLVQLGADRKTVNKALEVNPKEVAKAVASEVDWVAVAEAEREVKDFFAEAADDIVNLPKGMASLNKRISDKASRDVRAAYASRVILAMAESGDLAEFDDRTVADSVYAVLADYNLRWRDLGEPLKDRVNTILAVQREGRSTVKEAPLGQRLMRGFPAGK